MALDAKQRGVAARMAVAVLITASLGVIPLLWSGFPRARVTTEGRLRCWLAFAVLVAVWVFVAIARIARHRFFTPEDIDGGGDGDGTARVKMLQ